mmetsp:Transcript_27389/g.39672  ORF Transcript_27389/g.39672 Transcript_27389/m.39672 type:complete len:99 (+) Transcript_27389:270-566(+)
MIAHTLNAACSCASCCLDAIKEKFRGGETLLHAACKLGYQASLENISLLLKIWPVAMNEKNSNNETTFHVAHRGEKFMEIILLLLNAWLELTGNKDSL